MLDTSTSFGPASRRRAGPRSAHSASPRTLPKCKPTRGAEFRCQSRYRAAPAVTPAPAATSMSWAPGAASEAARENADASDAVCIRWSSATMTRSCGRPSWPARALRKRGSAGAATIASISSEAQSRCTQAPTRRKRCSAGEMHIGGIGNVESQNIPVVDQSHGGTERLVCAGKVRASLSARAPGPRRSRCTAAAAPAGENGKCSLIPWPGSASLATMSAQLIAFDLQEAVDDLQRGEHATGYRWPRRRKTCRASRHADLRDWRRCPPGSARPARAHPDSGHGIRRR